MFKSVFNLIVVNLVLIKVAGCSDLYGILQDFVSQNVSEIVGRGKCTEDLLLVRNGLQNREAWALRMLDASGHIGSDFVWGNNLFIGSPISCDAINTFHGAIPNSKFILAKSPIIVNYRVVHVRHFSKNQFFIGSIEKNVVDFGLCIPNNCANEDVEKIFKSLLKADEFTNKTLLGSKTVIMKTKELKFNDGITKTLPYRILFIIVSAIVGLMFVDIFVKAFHFDAQEKPEKSPFWIKFVSCFSISDNANIILSAGSRPDSVLCVHGIRVISTIIVIVGHVAVFALSATANVHHVFLYDDKFWAQPLMTLHLYIDTFCTLSGLVLSYVFSEYLKSHKIKNRISFFFKMVFERYTRHTPPYAIALLFSIVVTKLLKDISPYYLMDDNDEKCSRLWWHNLLYINNFIKFEDSCMLWSWFLAADLQCFLVGSILLLIWHKSEVAGRISFGIIFLASTLVTAYFSYVLRQGFTMDMISMTSEYLYSPFWVRISPYFIGMLTGKFLSEKQFPPNGKDKWIAFGWIMCTASLIFLIFLHAFNEVPEIVSLLYGLFGRCFWSAATGWLILACYFGYGGIVNRFLSAKCFIPLSRMTYAAYLINPIWITFITMVNGVPYYLDFPMLFISSLGFAMSTFLLSFTFMLFFETPFIRLRKLLG